MVFKLSQWTDYLSSEGYDTDGYGYLSEDDFAEISYRLQRHTLLFPPELDGSDFLELIESGNYDLYVGAMNGWYEQIIPLSSDNWQVAYTRFSEEPGQASPPKTVTFSHLSIDEFSSIFLTDSLVDEILNNTQGIERYSLVILCEQAVKLLLLVGRNDEAAFLLQHLSVLYEELEDEDAKNFALARASICYGDFAGALLLLRNISSGTLLAPAVSDLIPAITKMEETKERLKQIMPAIAALEQMRMRALERLEFDGSQIHDTWYKTEGFTTYQKKLNQRLISIVNKGISEMIQALIDGRVNSVEEAFNQFHTYTSLRGFENHKPFLGAGFRRNLLENAGDVDVDRLIEWSHITDQTERERALLKYTIDLRDSPKTSLRGYPANTVLINLDALRNSQDPQTRKKAEALYRNATGKDALTGRSDAVYAGLLREGAKATVPMVLAMMVAGPFGAYAEGTVAATEIISAGRVVWTGVNAAGKAGWVARGAGLAVEAPIFWAASDSIHAALIGGGDYFTAHGLASSFLMLGGLKIFGSAWRATGGAYLARAARAAPALKIPLAVGSKGGELGTELAGFFGIGQFEQLIGLAPPQDTTLRQELFEAGITLVQLKMAVAAGNAITGNMMPVKILEAKLSSARSRLEQNLAARRMSLEDYEAALEEISQLEIALAQLEDPALAGELVSKKQGEALEEAQRVAEYSATRARESHDPSKPTHLKVARQSPNRTLSAVSVKVDEAGANFLPKRVKDRQRLKKLIEDHQRYDWQEIYDLFSETDVAVLNYAEPQEAYQAGCRVMSQIARTNFPYEVALTASIEDGRVSYQLILGDEGEIRIPNGRTNHITIIHNHPRNSFLYDIRDRTDFNDIRDALYRPANGDITNFLVQSIGFYSYFESPPDIPGYKSAGNNPFTTTIVSNSGAIVIRGNFGDGQNKYELFYYDTRIDGTIPSEDAIRRIVKSAYIGVGRDIVEIHRIETAEEFYELTGLDMSFTASSEIVDVDVEIRAWP